MDKAILIPLDPDKEKLSGMTWSDKSSYLDGYRDAMNRVSSINKTDIINCIETLLKASAAGFRTASYHDEYGAVSFLLSELERTSVGEGFAVEARAILDSVKQTNGAKLLQFGSFPWAAQKIIEGKSVRREYINDHFKIYRSSGFYGTRFSGNQLLHFSDEDINAKNWEECE